jgi:hypothetical protein
VGRRVLRGVFATFKATVAPTWFMHHNLLKKRMITLTRLSAAPCRADVFADLE